MRTLNLFNWFQIRPNNFILMLGNFLFYYNKKGSRDSVVSIATSYGLDDGGIGVRVTVGSRMFYSPRRPDRIWG
jgi:hypothetical protein